MPISTSLLSSAHFVANDKLMRNLCELLQLRTTGLLVSATSTHVPPCLSATSNLDLVFDVHRALSVIDCDDCYYNFM